MGVAPPVTAPLLTRPLVFSPLFFSFASFRIPAFGFSTCLVSLFCVARFYLAAPWFLAVTFHLRNFPPSAGRRLPAAVFVLCRLPPQLLSLSRRRFQLSRLWRSLRKSAIWLRNPAVATRARFKRTSAVAPFSHSLPLAPRSPLSFLVFEWFLSAGVLHSLHWEP